MKKTIILMLACMCVFMNASAQRNSGRLSLGVGLLYENGMDVTLAYEHEMNYRHAWEFFANGYLKWTECKSCGHICPESFWRNYRTYGFGVAYKPCVVRGRNHYGNLRIGASAGSDTNKFSTYLIRRYVRDIFSARTVRLYPTYSMNSRENGQ